MAAAAARGGRRPARLPARLPRHRGRARAPAAVPSSQEEAQLVGAALEAQAAAPAAQAEAPRGGAVAPGPGADESNVPAFFAIQLKEGKFVMEAPKPPKQMDASALADALDFEVVGKVKGGAPCCTTPLTLRDVDEAADLLMSVFFKKRFGVDNKEMFFQQRERVAQGLRLGVESGGQSGRLLMATRLGERGGGELCAMAEVSLPGGNRFGAEKLRPETPPDEAYLADVAVSKKFRGQGLGKAILKAAEEVTSSFGCNSLYMHVRLDNPEALGLFEGQGYEEPAEAKASLTADQIAQRSNPALNVMAKLNLAEAGHKLLMRRFEPDGA